MRYNEIPTITGRKVVTIETNKGAIRGRINRAAHNCFYVTQVDENGRKIESLQIRATLVSTITVGNEVIEVEASRF